MRTSIAGALFLLAGAGAATVAALDTTGNNIALNGSDTLHDVTIDILGACGAATGNGISYLGGGSSVGAAQMASNLQQVSPMSRAMKSGEFCTEAQVTAVYATNECDTPCNQHPDSTTCAADPNCAFVGSACVTGSASACTAVAGSAPQCGWNGSRCVGCTTFTDQTSCTTPTAQGESICLWNGSACSVDPNLAGRFAAGLLLGLDGVAVVANETNACTTVSQNGFGAGSMAVTSDGTALGAAVPNCVGCDPGTSTYTFADTFDALKLLYFGLPHDNVSYDCGSPARKTLIRQWKYVFSTDCSTGDTACAPVTSPATAVTFGGITHAWRRSDLSGTSDAFISILAGGDLPNKGASKVGIGTPPKITPATLKMNPFCNSADANSTASPPPTTNGGSADYVDNDPVRSNCAANSGAVGDDVCEGNRTPAGSLKFRGDLGVVLPVLIPDTTSTKANEIYNAVNGTIQACSGSCTPVNVIKSTQSTGIPCPVGTLNIGGECLMPFVSNTNGNDPRCYSASTIKCSDTTGNPDSRMYNLPVVVPTADVPQQQRGGNPFQWAVDTFLKPVRGAFYRAHETHHSTASSGICQENDDTSQIGCLVDSDPCSVGYAGREASASFPGGSQLTNKALLIKNVSPFASGGDQDANIESLYTSSGTLYPFSRRLYFATYYGFGNLKGGESALATCFENDPNVSGSIAAHHFVKIPAAGGRLAGVQCLDYDETKASAANPPPPNTQGLNQEAFSGCGFTGNNNACAGVTITH
jgi:hypothetical protein